MNTRDEVLAVQQTAVAMVTLHAGGRPDLALLISADPDLPAGSEGLLVAAFEELATLLREYGPEALAAAGLRVAAARAGLRGPADGPFAGGM